MTRPWWVPALASLPGCLLLAEPPERVQFARDPGAALAVGADDHPCTLFEHGVRCDDASSDAPLGAFEALATDGAGGWVALDGDGYVEGWGGSERPPRERFDRVRGRGSQFCGFEIGERPVCWGFLTGNDVPDRRVRDVHWGYIHACWIEPDGALDCTDDLDGDRPPRGTFEAVTMFDGRPAACALGDDGALACWGDVPRGAPTGRFSVVAAGDDHACALRVSGEVECWGDDDRGQASPPDATFVTLDVALDVSCGVTTDGEPECWGDGRPPP